MYYKVIELYTHTYIFIFLFIFFSFIGYCKILSIVPITIQ